MTALVFIINGRPRAGKDTLAAFMAEALTEHLYSTIHYSSIDPVRNVLSELGIDVSAKTVDDRILLSTVGSAVEAHSHFRSKGCIDAVQRASNTLIKPAIFMMIRETEIIERVRNELRNRGNTVHRVLVQSSRAEVPATSADQDAENMPWDFKANNYGTLECLKREANAIVNLTLMRREASHAS